ncbi:ABC transporter permease [Gordonia sp. CPCC 205333]|uniref:ABC transporter permease n=1 Tax=Gordonia sp. CPCC 205333 TaxID=3140790 RepID=UPI003AF3DBBB
MAILTSSRGDELHRLRGSRQRRGRTNGRVQIFIGFALLAVLALVCVLAPWIAPYDPISGDAAQKYLSPGSPGHLLGTDDQGRDTLSRLLYGGRTSLIVAVLASTAATVIGSTTALIAGFSGDKVAGLIMRTIDIMFAFPVIIIAVALALVFDPGITVLVLAIVFAAVPYVARVIFAEVKQQRGHEYVESAVSLGAGFWSILTREVLPNVIGQIVVYGTSLVGAMVVFSSSLSALGIGVQPPDADWGRMIADGAKVIISGNFWLALLPGLAILVVALTFNWLGDGLRDAADPHRRRHNS